MLRSDEYGNVYDDGQLDPRGADPSQRFITTYTSDEFGNSFPQQVFNPNYDWKTYDPEGLKEQEDWAAKQTSKRGGGFGVLDKIGGFIDDNKYKLAAAAVGGYALAPYLTGAAALPAAAGTGAAGGVGGLSMAGVPAGFTGSGALGFGGATFGAPTALTGVMGGALPAAAATSGATSGIAKLAESMGINKAAEMLGMNPTELMKLAGGVIAGGATALANRGSGNSAPIDQTGFQGQIDPNALKYVGNNQYIKNPVVKAAAGGGIKGLGMQGMAPIEYSAGGKYLSGPGDGMSDSIKANIEGKQEARLADAEFVLPADVVSHIGNGSSNAGAKKLHAMMDRIREARTGNPKQGKQIKAEKFLPA